MKKTMLILIAVVLVLILLVGGLIWYLVSALSGAGGAAEKLSVEAYLAEAWPDYSLEEWDAKNGDLRLSRSLRLTYKQLEKYGDQPEMNELVLGHLSTMEQIALGLTHSCGEEVRSITIVGLSSDGQTAYTVSRDGTITTCWEREKDDPTETGKP